MKISNVHYYAVQHGDDTNFYRLRVDAETHLGVSGYREGWFSATAVDRLFGSVSETGTESGLAAKEAIRKAYEDAVTKATQEYLTLALHPNTTFDQLEKAFEVRRRVLVFPKSNGEIFKGAAEISYNPDRGVAIPHSDEKLVIILSSNPNEVVASIANVADEEKTILSINNLSKLVGQRTRNDFAADNARSDVQKQQVYSLRRRLEAQQLRLSPTAPPAPALTADQLQSLLRTEITGLRTMLDIIAQ